MSERQIDKIPARSERYAEVMAEAARLALARSGNDTEDATIMISDVFGALCLVHPESFAQLLGCSVALPKTNCKSVYRDPTDMFLSSEVDRYLARKFGIWMRYM